MDERTKRFVAVGASVGANCTPCREYHIAKARALGLEPGVIEEAVEAARVVRGGATAGTDRLARKLPGDEAPGQSAESRESSRCCP